MRLRTKFVPLSLPLSLSKDKLDGIQQYNKRKRSESDTPSQSLEDYLTLEDDIISRPLEPGKKRVSFLFKN